MFLNIEPGTINSVKQAVNSDKVQIYLKLYQNKCWMFWFYIQATDQNMANNNETISPNFYGQM